MSAAADRPMGRDDITGRDAIPDDVHCWLGALERNQANRAEEFGRPGPGPDAKAERNYGGDALRAVADRLCSGAGREPTLDHARPMATGPSPGPGNTDNAGKVSARLRPN